MKLALCITGLVQGQRILATLDGESPILGSHPMLGILKGILGFGTSRGAGYRNLRVFEASPNPQWDTENHAPTLGENVSAQ